MQRDGGGEEEKENGSSRQSISSFKKKKTRNILSLWKLVILIFFLQGIFSQLFGLIFIAHL